MLLRSRPVSTIRSALRHDGVRRLLLSEALSGLGDGIFWVGLLTEIARRDGGARWFAIAAIARLGPRALMSTPAGALADRLDRRRLLVGLDSARAVVMILLAVLVARHAPLAPILGLVLLTYVFATPYRPALTAAIPLVADERDSATVSALFGTVRQSLTFLGPLVGVGVIDLGPSSWAFGINGLTFGASAMLLGGIASLSTQWRVDGDGAGGPVAAPQRLGPEQTAGLWLVVTAVFLMYLIRGAELVLHVLVAKDRLGLGAEGVGILGGAIGLGALAMMPVSARLAAIEEPAAAIVVSLAANALPLALLAAVHSPEAAAVGLFLQGAGLVAFEVVTLTLVQRLYPLHLLGRTFGHVNTASNAGRLAGALAIPMVLGAVGLRGSLVGLCVLVLAATAPLAPGLFRLGHSALARKRELQPIVDVLARSALFENASASALERVAAGLATAELAAGTEVIREGDEADALYLARTGEFDVFVGDRLVNTMGPDDWFGEIGLIHRRPRTATVVARTDAEVWRVRGDDFLAAVSDSAAAPTALLETVAQRLARTPVSAG